jgi:hypothetical protein
MSKKTILLLFVILTLQIAIKWFDNSHFIRDDLFLNCLTCALEVQVSISFKMISCIIKVIQYL